MIDSSAASNKLLYSIGIGLGVTALSGLGYWYWHSKKNAIPVKWRRVGILNNVYLFPIKSCGPLQLEKSTELDCDVLGLLFDGVRDRGLMLIDENNKMITARVYPHMVLIHPKVIGSKRLLITYKNMEPLGIDLTEIGKESGGKEVHTVVWDTKLDAITCGEKYDKWFSQAILGKDAGLHLIYYPYNKPTRAVQKSISKEPFVTSQDTGSFCDTTSYMLINLASIDDLNSRIPNPVDALQFRGNFCLKMDEPVPFAEDKFKWVKIGDDKIFRVVSPCSRCIFPNINAYTGQRDPDKQPAKMLKSYRSWPKYPSPVFGIHLGVRQPGGPVKENDIVYIEDN